ncbi:MAG: hypothetical protein ACYC1K_03565 [Minisyncoccota bacterium]
MPVKNRDKKQYQKEYAQQQARGEEDSRHQRYLARKAVDDAGIDRKGKHVAHKVAITRGGSNNKNNIEVVAPKKNLSFKRNSDHTPKK